MDYPGESTPATSIVGSVKFQAQLPAMYALYYIIARFVKMTPQGRDQMSLLHGCVRPLALSLILALLTAHWLTFSSKQESIFTQVSPWCLVHSCRMGL